MATALVKDIIDKAYTKVNGEFEAQVEGSDDWKTYLAVLNQVIENLVHTPYVKWQIYFNPAFNVGVVADGTLSYVIAGFNGLTIGNSPFDNVYFDLGGKVVAKYKIVDAAMFQSSSSNDICMIAGNSIYLKSTEAKIVGATLRVPAYIDPAPYTLGSQPVIVDSVPWVIASMAEFIANASPVPFIARNADKYGKEAAIFMKEMRENNRRTQALIIKKLDPQIGHSWQDVLNVMTIQDL